LRTSFRVRHAGLILIGVPREEAVALVERVAYNSAPKLPLRAFNVLTDDWQTTRQIAAKIKLPTNTTRRALEELAGRPCRRASTSRPGSFTAS
jgi:hypothetical protein